jgi:hypothetical protein
MTRNGLKSPLLNVACGAFLPMLKTVPLKETTTGRSRMRASNTENMGLVSYVVVIHYGAIFTHHFARAGLRATGAPVAATAWRTCRSAC